MVERQTFWIAREGDRRRRCRAAAGVFEDVAANTLVEVRDIHCPVLSNDNVDRSDAGLGERRAWGQATFWINRHSPGAEIANVERSMPIDEQPGWSSNPLRYRADWGWILSFLRKDVYGLRRLIRDKEELLTRFRLIGQPPLTRSDACS